MGYVIWFGVCIAVGAFASKKGRSGIGWFFFALFLSPLLGGIIVACLKDLNMEADVRQMEMEQQHLRERVSSNERMYEYRLGKVEKDVGQLQSHVMGAVASGQDGRQGALEAGTKQCPYCKETVRADAILCKHCRSELPVNQ